MVHVFVLYSTTAAAVPCLCMLCMVYALSGGGCADAGNFVLHSEGWGSQAGNDMEGQPRRLWELDRQQ